MFSCKNKLIHFKPKYNNVLLVYLIKYINDIVNHQYKFSDSFLVYSLNRYDNEHF